jgi:hypothetical protein
MGVGIGEKSLVYKILMKVKFSSNESLDGFKKIEVGKGEGRLGGTTFINHLLFCFSLVIQVKRVKWAFGQQLLSNIY